MREYRAYLVGPDEGYKSVKVLQCADDAEAVKEALKMVDGHDVELWASAQMIGRLKKPRHDEAATPAAD